MAITIMMKKMVSSWYGVLSIAWFACGTYVRKRFGDVCLVRSDVFAVLGVLVCLVRFVVCASLDGLL